MTCTLKSHSLGPTMVLTLSDPTAQHYLNAAVCIAGTEAINAAERNADVRAVILTTDGQHFCQGVAPKTSATDWQDTAQALDTWCDTLRQFSKPVLVAVEGACVGAGLSLALSADMVVAAHNSRWVHEGTLAGHLPMGGSSAWLQQQLPRPLAMGLLMGGLRINVQRLFNAGVISHISEPGAALHDAHDMAARLNTQAQAQLASIKEAFNLAEHDSPTQVRKHELAAIAQLAGR
jgi:enoyl-CoA hydratase/carnithine racemase